MYVHRSIYTKKLVVPFNKLDWAYINFAYIHEARIQEKNIFFSYTNLLIDNGENFVLIDVIDDNQL